jgi:hypothetical protein
MKKGDIRSIFETLERKWLNYFCDSSLKKFIYLHLRLREVIRETRSISCAIANHGAANLRVGRESVGKGSSNEVLVDGTLVLLPTPGCLLIEFQSGYKPKPPIQHGAALI